MGQSPYTDLERPPLHEAALRRGLLGGLWTDLRVVAETGSTNADVAAVARAGAPEGLVLVAERQTAGRGRLGRVWESPARAGIARRGRVLRASPRALEAWSRRWRDGDVEAVREAYLFHRATIGREVRAALPDGTELTGRADGIDADGRLVLAGGRVLAAGDVTHL